jgi:hypothetical protein
VELGATCTNAVTRCGGAAIANGSTTFKEIPDLVEWTCGELGRTDYEKSAGVFLKFYLGDDVRHKILVFEPLRTDNLSGGRCLVVFTAGWSSRMRRSEAALPQRRTAHHTAGNSGRYYVLTGSGRGVVVSEKPTLNAKILGAAGRDFLNLNAPRLSGIHGPFFRQSGT